MTEHIHHYSQLEKLLGVEFRNKVLITEALTHRSYLNECRGCVKHNERLEFLGDAVIEFVVTEHIYAQFPDIDEGELTRLRSYLVCADRAYEAAQMLGLEPYLLMSRGEREDVKSRRIILANAFEAFIAAVRLDRGLDVARYVIKLTLLQKENMERYKSHRCPKSFLQELMQASSGITPTYKTVEESGPDHDKTFIVDVCADLSILARGSGKSKASAEKCAAEAALDKLILTDQD